MIIIKLFSLFFDRINKRWYSFYCYSLKSYDYDVFIVWKIRVLRVRDTYKYMDHLVWWLKFLKTFEIIWQIFKNLLWTKCKYPGISRSIFYVWWTKDIPVFLLDFKAKKIVLVSVGLAKISWTWQIPFL